MSKTNREHLPLRKKTKSIFTWIFIIIGIFIFLGISSWVIINLGSKTKSNFENITPDGKLKKTIIKEGKGQQPKKGSKVKVHYTGTLTNGKKFDSSLDRNEPFVFTIGQGEIQGWSLGVATMKVGEKSRFSIHSDLAYGDNGYPPVIPAKATLIFDIELLEIK